MNATSLLNQTSTLTNAPFTGGLIDCHWKYFCPPGMFLANVSGCAYCPAGTYRETGGATSVSDCQKCPAGSWRSLEGGTAADNCTKCDTGKYLDTAGASAEAQCLPCPAGKFGVSAGVSSCANCPTGKYSTGDIAQSGVCLECPSGTYSDVTGASSNNTCVLCKVCGAGEYVGQPCSAPRNTTCTRCKQCDWGNQWMQRRCSDSSNHLNIPGNDTVCRPVNTKPVLRFSSVNYNCHDNTYCCCCCLRC